MTKLIWGICAALGLVWLAGFVFKIFEDVIHILLVPLAALAVFNIVMGRRAGPASD